MALRNQPSFLEKSIVNLLVLSEDAIIQITEVRSLERPHRGDAISDQMLGRLKDIKRIPTNVDELRFREHFQQHFDPAGMTRRFQDQRFFVLERQLLQEPSQRRLPFGQFLRRSLTQGQKAVVESGS